MKEIKEAYRLYRQKIFRHFLFAPRFLERLNFLHSIKFYLHDLNVNVVLGYREGIKIQDGRKADCDISLSSATLQFILKNEYGANTTNVNGKFERISDKGDAVFARHFAPQEYMKMGYGITNPLITFKIVLGKLLHKIRNKAWDINPTAD